MRNPEIEKIMHEIERMKNAMGMMQSYIAGLSHRMNSLATMRDSSRGAMGGTDVHPTVVVGGDEGGGNNLLSATPGYRNTDGSQNDDDLDLTQTLVTDTLAGVDPEDANCYDARGYLANVLFLERCGENFWVVLNHSVTFFCEDTREYGNLILKFADDPNDASGKIKRGYPVCVLAD